MVIAAERIKQISGSQQKRSFSIELREHNSESREMTFSFSSEEPFLRWWGNEILSHDGGAADLSRLNSKANFLWNHDRDVVLGVLKSAWIDSDRRGHCTIRWSKSADAEKYKQEVEDGILSNVSVAYSIDEVKEVNNNILVTKWCPFEVSLVSVPADYTVGIGRSQKGIFIKDKGEFMELDTELSIDEIRQQERDRVASIMALGKKHSLPDLAEQLIAGGKSIEEARAIVLDKISSRHQEPVAQPVNPLGLTEKEQRRYSIVRALNAAINNDWSKAGFERECSSEIAKRANKDPKGFFVPVRDLKVEQRAPYIVGVPTMGGNTVETELLAENFIDLLRNRVTAIGLGATMLTGLQGNIQIPRQSGATTTYWVAENGAITQSEATFDQIGLSPKTIAARSQFSRLMLLQSSIDIENFIRMDFAKTIALGIDLAVISGTGAAGQPRGILNTPGIGSVALGANGGVPTWNAIVQLETEIAQDNADIGSMAYLTNAKARGNLKTTLKSASAVSEFIWQDTNISNGIGSMNGYKAACTNQVASNYTKGTGTNLSAIIFGAWDQVIIGEWGLVEILPNQFGAGFNSGAVDIRVMQTIDINCRYAEAFAAITDCVTI